MVNNIKCSESVTKYKMSIVRNIEFTSELLVQSTFSRVKEKYINVSGLRNEWKMMKKIPYQ